MIRTIILLSAVFASGLAVSSYSKDKTVLALTPVPRSGNQAKLHESFNAISREGKAQLIFLGDSITQGWSRKGAEAWEQYWAPYQAANFGIGGDRTEHVLWRLANGNYDGLNPKLTVLMIGTNNTGHEGREMAEHGGTVYTSSAEETAAGVTAIIDAMAEKQPEMKVLLLAIFPRGADRNDPKRQKNDAINKLISKLGERDYVTYLNINDNFLKPDGTLPKEIMPDLLHLNADGYKIWSQAIESTVKELMGE